MFSSLTSQHDDDDDDDLGIDLFGIKRKTRDMKRERDLLETERQKLSEERKQVAEVSKQAEKDKKELEKKELEIQNQKQDLRLLILREREQKEQLKILQRKVQRVHTILSDDREQFIALRKQSKIMTTDELAEVYKVQIQDLAKQRVMLKNKHKMSKRDSTLPYKPTLAMYVDYKFEFKIDVNDRKSNCGVPETAFDRLVKNYRFSFGPIMKDSNGEEYDALAFACYKGYAKEIETVIKKSDPTVNDGRAIREACGGDPQMDGDPYTKITKLLLEDPLVDPSCRTQECIETAVRVGNFRIVKLLLAHEKVVPTYDCLLAACQLARYDIVEYLLFVDRRVDPCEKNNKCLIEVVHRNKPEIVKLLLRHPAVSMENDMISVENLESRNEVFCRACKNQMGSFNRLIIRALILDPRFMLSIEETIDIAQKLNGIMLVDYILSLIGKKRKNRGSVPKKNELEEENLDELEEKLIMDFDHLADRDVILHLYRTVCSKNFQLTVQMIQGFSKQQFDEVRRTVRIEKEKEREDEVPRDDEIEIIENPEEYVEKEKLKNLTIGMECPITQELMVDPVILVETGQSYERKAIAEWLKNKSTDPLTRKNLYSKKLVENIALRNQIDEWKRAMNQD